MAPSCKHCDQFGLQLKNNTCGSECYFNTDDGECKEKSNDFKHDRVNTHLSIAYEFTLTSNKDTFDFLFQFVSASRSRRMQMVILLIGR